MTKKARTVHGITLANNFECFYKNYRRQGACHHGMVTIKISIFSFKFRHGRGTAVSQSYESRSMINFSMKNITASNEPLL